MLNKSGLIQWTMAMSLWALALPAVANPDPVEFEKVQRAMNERIEQLEAELDASRQEWQERERLYQLQLNEAAQQSRESEAVSEEAERRAVGARDWGAGWRVRRAAPETDQAPVAAEEDRYEPEAAAEVIEEDADGPDVVEVTGAVRLGRRRLKTRREDIRWRPAMTFRFRNLTDAPLRVHAWAHQPGRMGWNLDEFGVTLISLPPQATITDQMIPHDEGTDLHLVIDGKTYTFEVESR